MSPLHPLHEQSAADFQDYAQTPLVATFGQPQAEYAAVRKSAAIMDMSHRGLLELTGRDRLTFLNNLLSNQTYDTTTKTGLSTGSGVYAFLLNVKGRIVTDLNVLELGDSTLLEMESRMVEPVRQTLDRYIFSEQVKLIPRTSELHELFLTGPKALDVLNQSLESPLPDLAPLNVSPARLLAHDILIFRDDPCAVPGYFLLCPTNALAAIWSHLTESTTTQHSGLSTQHYSRARPFGWAVFNTTRIEAGRPLFGIDFDDSILPAETGQLARAVSFTKGCYLGQEIVARMHARGQLARQIIAFKMESDALPLAGQRIFDDADNDIGAVTSSTLSPILSNTPIGLAIVKRPHIAPGSTLRIHAEGTMRTATVVVPPFV